MERGPRILTSRHVGPSSLHFIDIGPLPIGVIMPSEIFVTQDSDAAARTGLSAASVTDVWLGAYLPPASFLGIVSFTVALKPVLRQTMVFKSESNL